MGSLCKAMGTSIPTKNATIADNTTIPTTVRFILSLYQKSFASRLTFKNSTMTKFGRKVVLIVFFKNARISRERVGGRLFFFSIHMSATEMNAVFRPPCVVEPSLAVAKGNTFEAFVGASLIAKSHVTVLKKRSESVTSWSFYYTGGVTQDANLLLRIRMKNSFKDAVSGDVDRYIQHAVGTVFLRRYFPQFNTSTTSDV